jgi:hypothetical protein
MIYAGAWDERSTTDGVDDFFIPFNRLAYDHQKSLSLLQMRRPTCPAVPITSIMPVAYMMV